MYSTLLHMHMHMPALQGFHIQTFMFISRHLHMHVHAHRHTHTWAYLHTSIHTVDILVSYRPPHCITLHCLKLQKSEFKQKGMTPFYIRLRYITFVYTSFASTDIHRTLKVDMHGHVQAYLHCMGLHASTCAYAATTVDTRDYVQDRYLCKCV